MREADLGGMGSKEVDLIGGDLRSSEMHEANLSRAVLLVANLDSQTCRARKSTTRLCQMARESLGGLQELLVRPQMNNQPANSWCSKQSQESNHGYTHKERK